MRFDGQHGVDAGIGERVGHHVHAGQLIGQPIPLFGQHLDDGQLSRIGPTGLEQTADECLTHLPATDHLQCATLALSHGFRA